MTTFFISFRSLFFFLSHISSHLYECVRPVAADPQPPALYGGHGGRGFRCRRHLITIDARIGNEGGGGGEGDEGEGGNQYVPRK